MGRKGSFSVFFCLLVGSWLAIGKPPTTPETKPTVKTILGEATDIYALAFSPDGKRLLAGGEKPGQEQDQNPELVEWDVQKMSVCRRYDSGHYGQIRAVNYSPSGRFNAIGFLDGFVSVRDLKGHALLSFMSIENESSELLLVSAFDKTEEFVYSIVHRNVAQRRSIRTGQTNIYYVPCDGYGISSAASTRDGKAFICCSPKISWVYENRNGWRGKEIKAFHVFDKPLARKIGKLPDVTTFTHVAISDDASTAMAVEYYGQCALFDLKNDKLIKTWKCTEGLPIYTVVPFHKLNWFATGNDAGDITIWDEKGTTRATLSDNKERSIAALAVRHDNGLLASSGEGRPIVIWNLQPFLKNELRDKK